MARAGLPPAGGIVPPPGRSPPPDAQRGGVRQGGGLVCAGPRGGRACRPRGSACRPRTKPRLVALRFLVSVVAGDALAGADTREPPRTGSLQGRGRGGG